MPPYSVVQTAPSNRNAADQIAMWAVVALVVALVAGVGAYFVERANHPGWGQLSQYDSLAAQDGQLAGHNAGWTQGVKQGKTEESELGSLEATKASTSGYQSGITDGISAGQSLADARSGFGDGLAASSYDPSNDVDDLGTLDSLSDGLGDDDSSSLDSSFGLTDPSMADSDPYSGDASTAAGLPDLGSNY